MGTRARSGIQYATTGGDVTKVSPDSIIHKIETLRTGDPDHYDRPLPLLPIPGTGELRETCGDDIPRACSGCGRTHTVGRTCKRSLCPRCWKSWARRRTTTIGSKLEALRIVRESVGPGWRGWMFHHVVLSPPEGFKLNRDDPLDATFDILKEILGELGADTGYLFYHPLRGPDDDDRGFWRYVLPDGDPVGFQELIDRHDLKHSPHFHAVVLSKNVDTQHCVKAVEEQTGWVIHRITKSEQSNISLFNEYDLLSSVSYCLSHTGIDDNRAAYRPYGEVANFTAWDGLKRKMDGKCRAVAANTLGLDPGVTRCTEEREKLKTRTAYVLAQEEVNLGAAHGNTGAQAVEEVKVTSTIVEECNGRLIDVSAFPRYLNNAEWVAQAPYAHEMQEAWEEWRDRDHDHADDWDRPPDTD